MQIEYYSGGRKHRLTFRATTPDRPRMLMAEAAGPLAAAAVDVGAPALLTAEVGDAQVILTPSISLGDAKSAEVRWLRRHHGFEVIREGLHGKVLMAAPPEAPDRERVAAAVAVEVVERGNVSSAQPNFVRVLDGPQPGDPAAEVQWALDNPGNPGVVGADVAANAAWTISTGSPEVAVAVIDDGIETAHPALRHSIRAQRNFIEGEDPDDASPSKSDDYHGTACAGIIASRDDSVRGLAHGVSLIACRAATKKRPGWLTENFALADAIDWCWHQAAADVLSMSFRGPVDDLISAALNRARTEGRAGKGCALIAAAGNNGGKVAYPANLDGVVGVGATNQWDKRKTRDSEDGETNWASNSGTGLSLMAPGVKVVTTDLTGVAGAEPDAISGRFNGTSAAAPFVSAAAALVMSVRADLTEEQLRRILEASADSLGPKKWQSTVGFGRLNAYTALRVARRWTP